MAAGAFDAAVASVDKGFEPAPGRCRVRRDAARHALGPGRHRRQHDPERDRPQRHPVHAHRERVPVGLRRVPRRRDGGRERRARRRARDRRREDARQVDRRRPALPRRGRVTRSSRAARPRRCLFAPFATRHMHEFGTTREMLASVAVKNHYNGARDPYAHFQNEITVEDVLQSAPVCHPLHLLDCCPQTDGAAAALLVPAERAARVHRPARVRRRLRRRHRPPVPAREGLFTEIKATRLAAQRAYAMAGVGPEQIDCAEVHDCFTITEILDIEDLGFFEKGDGGRASIEGETALTGRLPVNTSGGLLAKGHPIGATGVAQITECWWQLRGDAGDRQIETRNGYALQHNAGGRGSGVSVVNILTNRNRERDGDAPARRARSRRHRPHRARPARREERAHHRDARRHHRRGPRVPRRPEVRAVLITAEGDAFCAGMDLGASTVAQAGKPGFASRTHLRSAARRRADDDPRALGARQADDRGRERRRGRPGRAPRARVRLRVRAARAPASCGRSPSGDSSPTPAAPTCLPRLVGLPRAKAMVMLGEGATGAEAVDLGLAYRCVDDARRSAARPRSTWRAAWLRARRVRSASRSGCSTRRSRPTSRVIARARGSLPGARHHVARLVEGMAAFRDKRDAQFDGT